VRYGRRDNHAAVRDAITDDTAESLGPTVEPLSANGANANHDRHPVAADADRSQVVWASETAEQQPATQPEAA